MTLEQGRVRCRVMGINSKGELGTDINTYVGPRNFRNDSGMNRLRIIIDI